MDRRYFSQKQWFEVKKNIDRFVYYKHTHFLFTMHSLKVWSGVDYLYIIVMFVSSVWVLILTAPFTAEDPF